MIAAGYEDGNDAAALRHGPAFKLALDRLPEAVALRSQPTISRLENLPNVRALLRMGRAVVGLYCASFRQVRQRIVLDMDDTFDPVHPLRRNLPRWRPALDLGGDLPRARPGRESHQGLEAPPRRRPHLVHQGHRERFRLLLHTGAY